jgi:hypothetical protein
MNTNGNFNGFDFNGNFAKDDMNDRLEKVNKWIEKVESEHNKRVGDIVAKHPYFFLNLIRTIKVRDGGLEFVYFLHNEDTNFTKIGYTSNLTERMRAIANSYRAAVGKYPKLNLLAVVPCGHNEGRRSEKYFHEMFKDNLIFGEWYDLSNEEYLYEIIGHTMSINEISIGDNIGCFEWDINQLSDEMNLEDLPFLSRFNEDMLEIIELYKKVDSLNSARIGNRDLAKAIRDLETVKNLSDLHLYNYVNTGEIKNIDNFFKAIR